MAEAEEIIIEKINRDFDGVKPAKNDYEVESWREFTDDWLEVNADKFMYYSHEDELFYRQLSYAVCYVTFELHLNLQCISTLKVRSENTVNIK